MLNTKKMDIIHMRDQTNQKYPLTLSHIRQKIKLTTCTKYKHNPKLSEMKF